MSACGWSYLIVEFLGGIVCFKAKIWYVLVKEIATDLFCILKLFEEQGRDFLSCRFPNIMSAKTYLYPSTG